MVPHFLSVFWTYVKRWWLVVPFVGMVIFVILFAKNKSDDLSRLIDQQRKLSEQHRLDLVELQRVHDEEIQQRTAIEARYRAVIDQINATHDAAEARLAQQKQTEIRQIISETHDNPVAMTDRINSLFGFQIYKP